MNLSAEKKAGSASAKGKSGEDAAVLALQKEKINVLFRNFRSPGGEIDLIAEDGETLVFIEVKNWIFDLENLRYGISEKKKRHIIETAKYFLSIYRKYNDRPIRFDVIFFAEDGLYTRFESAFTET